MKDFMNALVYLDKGLEFAKTYDALPALNKHTSVLVDRLTQDMTQIYAGSEVNEVATNLDNFAGDFYKPIHGMPELDALIAKYKPFAGKIEHP